MANQAQKDFKKFADNLKRTALGVKFSKTLFTNPNSLTPDNCLKVLKTLGLDIPEGVVVTAAVAQVIISGQAISAGLDAGKSISQLGQHTQLAGNAVNSLSTIAESQKWLDADSASAIRLSSNIGMIVCSAGTNVGAWVGMALELANTVAVKQGLADYYAIMNAQSLYTTRISSQAKILGDSFKKYQEKKISIYGLISQMAVETPDLWPQVVTPGSPLAQNFPGLLMLPTVGTSVTGQGTCEIGGNWPWPAKGKYVIARWESSKTIQFETLGKSFNKEMAAEFFFEMLLRPWIACYAIANDEIVGRGNMSMENIAALSFMVNQHGEISDKSNYVNMLIGSNLTPYDFDDNILSNIANEFVESSYKSIDTRFHESGISFGQMNKNFSVYQKDREVMRQKLQLVQDSEDITELAQYEYIYRKLQSYMDFQQTSFEKDPTLGGRLNEKFPEGTVRAWRQLQNYIAVVNMIDQFRTDEYLSQTAFAQKLLPFMPSVNSFSEKVEKINYLSTARSINRAALLKISEFTNIPAGKMIKQKASNDGAVKIITK